VAPALGKNFNATLGLAAQAPTLPYPMLTFTKQTKGLRVVALFPLIFLLLKWLHKCMGKVKNGYTL
jgi:hypothetical protein